MNIKQIESFLILSEELHYGRAAERLKISQPSLSQQIKALETSLNVVLFQKEGRNIVLSKAGLVFRQSATKIYHELLKVKDEMLYFQGFQRETIHLGASGSHLLLDVFKDFTDMFPDISLHVSEYPSRKTIQKVLDRQIDIGVVYQTEEIPDLEAELLFEEQFVAAIPCSHELANKEEIYLEDFENQPLVLLEKDLYLRNVLDAELQKRQIVPNIICELSNHYACLEFGKAQFGIVLTTESFVKKVPDSMVVKKIQNLPLKNKIVMIRRKEMLMDQQIEFLMAKIKETVK
ncbi:DNA-binding transcriptional LysR family regulator [Enterococcus sp. PF1-24]|uniref:LysR family transcriptional regulator n=1 Tax=unclassified Enterococcus TaxID=2608891 RepID=UPI0024740F4D|nr:MULTISPECIES: LysR family transcriptional regulator [unclassified Enterococcus]MDH6365810.1 DNA-binding transcriptional LysR family regulator [Enterococcus sp. PFB1-1]MDH6402910.1 DNA-binding transcriptional LysR family regulator [Enterococcus sp. PF1-24]